MSDIAISAPPRRPSLLRLVAAFVRRDWAIAWSYRFPFFVDLFQSMSSLVLVYFLSKLVNTSVSLGVGGGAAGYFGFVVIGLAVLEVLTVALVSFAQQLRTDQTTGTLEAVLATPTPPWLAVISSSAYDLLYAILSAVVMVVVAFAAFGLRFHVGIAGVGLAIGAFAVSLAGFAAFGVAYAAWVMVFKKGDSLLNFAGTAISLLSGVYFPIKLFPGPVRFVAQVLPVTQGNTVLRSILLDGSMPWARVGWLALTAAVLLPLSIFLLNRALHHARQAGTIGQF